MKRAAERVAKRRVCFGKHKRMKRAAERVAKRRICFGKHKRMKRAAEGWQNKDMLWEAQKSEACSSGLSK